MTYMLLVVEEPGDRRKAGRAEGERRYDHMVRFAEGLKDRGVLLGVESLASENTAVRVSARGGKPLIVDGPFAESKEMIGGFFLLSVSTREEALAIARECPAADWATIEVRNAAPCYEGSE